ncbi:hypothetical protein [Allosalinactinospora lopnorensis]|nr:hypothetical protein [Allosalinactinospora lopnorensis]
MDLISMQAAEEAALDEAQAIIARRARQGAPARHLSVVRDT